VITIDRLFERFRFQFLFSRNVCFYLNCPERRLLRWDRWMNPVSMSRPRVGWGIELDNDGISTWEEETNQDKNNLKYFIIFNSIVPYTHLHDIDLLANNTPDIVRRMPLFVCVWTIQFRIATNWILPTGLTLDLVGGSPETCRSGGFFTKRDGCHFAAGSVCRNEIRKIRKFK
jgi:hypothetical protein